MRNPDTPLFKMADIPIALGLLSRLPVRSDATRGADAAWAFPVVGLILGGLATVLGWVVLALGLPAELAAGVVLAASVGMTGAMHEDGLADTADGFWGGWDKARRLEIMKDSRIGTYGVIALVLSSAFRWVALVAVINAGSLAAGLIAVACVSRTPMVLMMSFLPNARGGGLSASVGQVRMNTAGVAIGVAGIVAITALGWAGVAVLATTAVSGYVVSYIALRKIEGQTGDVLGATQQISEITALTVLATILS